jgi:hypothetical protein
MQLMLQLLSLAVTSGLGDTIQPVTPFGLLIAEAFDSGMAPEDWHPANHPNTPPRAKAVLTDS